ncbi:hypothetical protein SAMN05421743_102193 [Thalassobacillus cyri]|uniref:DUF2071 domain-containing protein n=1 Tax=Thalassobacillus cyri TaxID=571932 RepID=A0A1H3XP99_9BACI|nr:DUF2071 domain-containing protein [Thalassobacillus cyri]SEA00368.1 hypothetical protein SAMN05421743_102193 [Thalassobacillus cyri]
MYQDILQQIDHRSTPIPDRPWLMSQSWDHLLFMHLRVSKEAVAEFIPKALELDTYDGEAWISIVPFEVNGMHGRAMPKIPFLHSYLELNVRTYVRYHQQPGVYFFSLDANLLPAVLGARTLALPYFYADMRMTKESGSFHLSSVRKTNKYRNFSGSYLPVSDRYSPQEGSLTEWLLERYVLWQGKGDTLIQGDIHHFPWEIYDAEALIETETVTAFLPENSLYGDPIFHYAKSRRVLFWPLKKIN